jgi:hypothetical protein
MLLGGRLLLLSVDDDMANLRGLKKELEHVCNMGERFDSLTRSK